MKKKPKDKLIIGGKEFPATLLGDISFKSFNKDLMPKFPFAAAMAEKQLNIGINIDMDDVARINIVARFHELGMRVPKEVVYDLARYMTKGHLIVIYLDRSHPDCQPEIIIR
jgi:hypothetical protein